jgi:hypothetical protein
MYNNTQKEKKKEKKEKKQNTCTKEKDRELEMVYSLWIGKNLTDSLLCYFILNISK